jgi:hypothetical protein
MPEQMDKPGVINEMSTSYNVLEEILAPLDKTQFVTEGVIPGWSIKDMLAHIASWHHRLLRWLDAAVHNQEPTISGPDNVEEMDASMHNFIRRTKLALLMKYWQISAPHTSTSWKSYKLCLKTI